MNKHYFPGFTNGRITLLGVSLIIFNFSSTFAQQVPAINTSPHIDDIQDVYVHPGTSGRYINVTGVNAGKETDQQVTLAIECNNKHLVEDMNIVPTSNGNAFIQYRLKEGLNGTAVVTVIATDNGTPAVSTKRVFHLKVSQPLKSAAPHVGSNRASVLSVHPNPVTPATVISFTCPATDDYATIELFSSTGQIIRQLFAGSVKPYQIQTLRPTLSGIGKGVYILKFRTESVTETQSVIITK